VNPSLPLALVALGAAGVVVALAGARLSYVTDRLADRTGVGEAVAGMVLLGAATSLAGFVVSISAAAQAEPSLAVSNSLGGIAIQTTFIVVADITYRRANLEHAAASLTNMMNSLLMVVLLAIVLIGYASPPVTILGIHPVTFLVLAAYGYGLRLAHRSSLQPMWRPKQTKVTKEDTPAHTPARERLPSLWVQFAALALIVTVAGFVVAQAGITVSTQTGLSGTAVGALLTGIVTSLPELVTTLAAVRLGALTLAVAGIVGGNTFDILFIAAADVVYRQESIYAAMTAADVFVLGWTMLIVGTLTAGLVQRDRKGIGFEGTAVLAIYVAGALVVGVLG
jgi:cation:H+ antiporter